MRKIIFTFKIHGAYLSFIPLMSIEGELMSSFELKKKSFLRQILLSKHPILGPCERMIQNNMMEICASLSFQKK